MQRSNAPATLLQVVLRGIAQRLLLFSLLLLRDPDFLLLLPLLPLLLLASALNCLLCICSRLRLSLPRRFLGILLGLDAGVVLLGQIDKFVDTLGLRPLVLLGDAVVLAHHAPAHLAALAVVEVVDYLTRSLRHDD